VPLCARSFRAGVFPRAVASSREARPRRRSAMTTVSTPTASAASTDWRERLALLLWSGTAPELAIQACRTDGVPESVVEAETASLRQQPAFAAATRLATQLRCRDWWLRTCASLAAVGEGPSHVDTRSELSEREFLSEYFARNRALLLPGAAAGWPAI